MSLFLDNALLSNYSFAEVVLSGCLTEPTCTALDVINSIRDVCGMDRQSLAIGGGTGTAVVLFGSISLFYCMMHTTSSKGDRANHLTVKRLFLE
jgi:hypothetical protein